jgi:hypothetical protein
MAQREDGKSMKKPGWKLIAWIAAGGVAGFSWYYIVGCTTGTCPITSNPYISTGYGALMGGLVAWNRPKQSATTTQTGDGE